MSETDALMNKHRMPSLWELLRDGVVLNNTGSVARDHLANERTYLAWIRTALAITGGMYMDCNDDGNCLSR